MRVLIYCMGLFLILLTGPAHAQDVNLNQGLMAHYDFNGGPEDKSENGWDGVVFGAKLTEDRFGNCLHAYGFSDSPNLVTLPHELLDGANSFSVSMWVKTDRRGVVFTAANRQRNNEFFIQILPAGNIGVTVAANPARTGQRIDGAVAVIDNQWHHLVVTRNSVTGMMQLYVDGLLDINSNIVLAGNELPRSSLVVEENGLHLGADQDCLGGCWDPNQQLLGSMDDVWIYNRVLNQDEVMALRAIDETIDYPTLSIPEQIESCQSASLDAGPGFDSYLWSTGETTQTITVQTTGVYTVTAQYLGCEFTDMVAVTLNEIPPISISASTDELSCIDRNVTLSASPGFDSYNWSNGDTGMQVTVSEPGQYTVTGTSTCGNRSSTPVNIDLRSDLELEVGSVLNCLTPSVTLTATAGFYRYTWSTGQSGRSISVQSPGEYSVLAEDLCGVQESAPVSILLEPINDLFIPNTFTPNGDGKNETFVLDDRLAEVHLKVFDRWGKLVYENQKYMNRWDGDELTTGTYYYRISSSCLPQPIKGWLKLIR